MTAKKTALPAGETVNHLDSDGHFVYEVDGRSFASITPVRIACGAAYAYLARNLDEESQIFLLLERLFGQDRLVELLDLISADEDMEAAMTDLATAMAAAVKAVRGLTPGE